MARLVVDGDPPGEVVRQAIATAFLANEEARVLGLEIIHEYHKSFFRMSPSRVRKNGTLGELESLSSR